MIIWEMFHERISLNTVLLGLLVNFVSRSRLEPMYISLSVSIRSRLVIVAKGLLKLLNLHILIK